jgi:Zn finger protein HypA/HybF involved in hydrogenase expression
MIEKTCKYCEELFTARLSKTKFCSVECKHNNLRISGLLSKTFGEVKKMSKKQNAYITIRNHARNIMSKSDRHRKCINCNYVKHVEVAHLKGISEFDDADMVSVINSLDNMVYLCPNCHWEFDKGSLLLPW